MDDHCATVTPVVNLPHESVMDLLSKPLPIALRTGGSASSPIPAAVPAAGARRDDRDPGRRHADRGRRSGKLADLRRYVPRCHTDRPGDGDVPRDG